MSHDLPTFQQNNILAIFFMLLTGACMVAVMVTLRYTDESLPSIQVAFIRYLFGLVIIFPFAISELKVRNLKIPIVQHGIRGTLHGFGVVLWFYSISQIPLAEATAINFTAPIFGAVFAIFLLKEKIKFRRIIAIFISLIGALIIIRPGIIHFNFFIFITLIASILMGMASVYIKKITLIDHPNAVVFYMPMVLTIVSLIPCIIFWKTPNIFYFFLLVSTGLTAFLAHICITKAFSSSDATYVLVFDYLRLPFTAVLAFFLFGEVTSFWVWVGGLIIFLSSVYVVYRERKSGKKESTSLITAKRL